MHAFLNFRKFSAEQDAQKKDNVSKKTIFHALAINHVLLNVGLNPAGIAITPNNQFAYVVNENQNSVPGANTVSVLNLNNNTLALTITSTTFNQPDTITMNAAGTKAYVTNSNYTTVSIIDVATNTVISPMIPVGQSPGNITISPDGQYAYVSNYTSDNVDVIALPAVQISAQGCKTQNRFLNHIDYINKLT